MDPAEIERLYKKYGPLVLRRARMLLRDDQAALDAMQEVFVRALRSGSGFRADASPMTWLYRITTNYCLNSIRDNARRTELLATQVAPAEGHTPLTPDERHAVLSLLARLPPDVGEVVVHYYIDEMKQEEIAGFLQVTRRYVRDRLDAFSRAATAFVAEAKEVS